MFLIKINIGYYSTIYILGYYNIFLSDWDSFIFFINLLPIVCIFLTIDIIFFIAKEVADPAIKAPRVIYFYIFVGNIANLLFIILICVIILDLADILTVFFASIFSYIFHIIINTSSSGLSLIFLVLNIIIFCSIFITITVFYCIQAFARDETISNFKFFVIVDSKLNVPIWFLGLIIFFNFINLSFISIFIVFVFISVITFTFFYTISISIFLL
jgi:hypothetical protein